MGWVVQEGYLLCKHENSSSFHDSATWRDAGQLQEKFFVLSINRKLEVFENNTKATRLESCYVVGFCGWDGGGLLKADTNGLELKIEKSPHKRMFLAPFNRLDLDKWCRALLAVVDPHSAAGEEVRRERRKLRKEAKRKQTEQEEKIRKWKEHQEKLAERERQRLLAREEAIKNMTPLERIDGLGSLDDETIRLLEKRRQRVHRRQAATTGRVNKSAFRKRLEEGAGGKLDNMQPLPSKRVDTQRVKTKVELPPPGQFIEISATSKSSFSRSRSNSSDSGSSTSRSDNDGELYPPPPPPPPRHPGSTDFLPPPPPPPPPLITTPQPLYMRASRSNSMRSSLDGGSVKSLSTNRNSMVDKARRISLTEPSKKSVEDQLASILGGSSRRITKKNSWSEVSADDDAETYRMPLDFPSDSPQRNPNVVEPTPQPISKAAPLAATLAAIRKNRPESSAEQGAARNWAVDGVMSSETEAATNRTGRNRSRGSQLSAEGKELLRKAMERDPAKTNYRKGLFDDSSSSDEEDALETFSSRSKSAGSKAVPLSNPEEGAPMVPTATSINEESSSESGSEQGGSLGLFTLPNPSTGSATSPKSATLQPRANGCSDIQVSVSFISSSVVKEGGKKPIGKYTFSMTTHGETHEFISSYHELEAVHTRLGSDFGTETLPKFPPKHWYRNNTKPENMQKRAQELVAYFQQLVRVPNILCSERFHMEFGTSRRFQDAIYGKMTPKTPTPTRIKKTMVSDTRSSAKSGLFATDSHDSDNDSVSSAEPPEPIVRKATSSEKDQGVSTLIMNQAMEEAKEDKKDTVVPARSRPSSRISAANVEAPERSRPNSVASVKKTTKKGGDSITDGTATVRPPNPFGAGRGQLLAAIRQGKELKKVEDSDEDHSTPQAQPTLVSSKQPVIPAPAPLNPGGSISDVISNAMAARRIHVEYDERSVISENSDDDWD